jgi:hypothetical protein
MKLFAELRKRIRVLIFGAPPASQPVPDPQPVLLKPGRPISAALSRTIEVLSRNPAINSTELAATIGVSPSYARTLLRRARARGAEPSPPAWIQSVRAISPAAPQADVNGSLRELSQRLTETEKTLAALRSVPVHGRASLNLNRRAEVLRLSEAGEEPARVAERLAIPPGEVEFVLKIDRILASAVQSR